MIALQDRHARLIGIGDGTIQICLTFPFQTAFDEVFDVRGVGEFVQDLWQFIGAGGF